MHGKSEQAGAEPEASMLSVSQHGMWVVNELARDSLRYAIPLLWQLTGPVDVPALEASVRLVVQRHKLLHSRLTTVDGKVVLVPDAPLANVFTLVDLRDVPFAERAATADRAIQDAARLPFDLTAGPPVRVTLVRSSDDEWDLLWTAHHIVFDGRSADIVVRELTRAYGALREGRSPDPPALSAQYADFVSWQRSQLRGERLNDLVSYWRSALDGADNPAPIPPDHPGTAAGEPPAGAVRLPVPAELSAALDSVARARGLTPFVLGLAAFYALLHHAGGVSDLSVGTPVANRPRTEFEDVVGPFVNTVVLRCSLAGDPELAELVDRAARTCHEAFAHQDLPFDTLVEHLRPARRPGVHPLFRVVFAMDHAPGLHAVLPGTTTSTGIELATPIAKFDLTWVLQDRGDNRALHVDYDSSRYDRATIIGLADRYLAILAAIAHGEDGRRLSHLDGRADGDGSVESLLRRMWSEALQRPVDLDDDFFGLGGYSMLASQLCARIRDLYQVDLPLAAFFDSPTVRGLAGAVRSLGTGDGQRYQPIARSGAEPSLSGLLDEIERMSDDEAAALVADIEQ